MADTLVNTLYPPAVETFQPAFVYTGPAAITFSISPFNAAEDIKYVHISVTDQRNNENVLKGSVAFKDNVGIYNGLLVSKFPQSTGIDSNVDLDAGLIHYSSELDLYSISIPTRYLRKEDTVKVTQETIVENWQDGDTGQNLVVSGPAEPYQYFNVGQYYKVQLRFDCCELDLAELEDTKKGSDQQAAAEAAALLQNYMVDQRPYFSEWSTVTLIKPILPINVYFPKLPENPQEISDFNKGLIRVAARVWFADTDENMEQLNEIYGNGRWEENEHLEQYRIQIYEADDFGNITNKLIIDTKKIYAEPTKINNTYEYGINHVLDLGNAKENHLYILVLEIWSNNGYYYTTTRTFKIAEFSDEYDATQIRWNDHPELNYAPGDIEINQEDGIAIINFVWDNPNLPGGNLYIKRACGKDNFKTWEIISVTKHNLGKVAVHIEDYTICSLHRYRYAVQYELPKGMWTKIYYSNVIYPKFYEMLLERQNRQIAIRYNGQITSWKPVVNRQKVDTLGGKYPKFVENAQMNYKQFSVQGLIAAEEDFNRKFLNEFQGKWNQDSQEYEYYYQGDMTVYDQELNGTYIIKNDTVADGDFGYNPDESTNIDGSPSGDQGNKYWNHESTRGHNALPEGYKKSIFTDTALRDDQDLGVLQYQHDLYPQNNWYWEREFREQLVQWLNDGEPKLYRSMPEGNVAVILTDVSLSPMTQLGRRLYQFTATMYEVGDGYSLESLDKLGIINIPKLTASYVEQQTSGDTPSTDDDDDSTDSDFLTTKQVGQLYLPNIYNDKLIGATSISEPKSYIWDSTTLTDRINNQYRSSLKSLVINTNSVYLEDVRIQFRSKPHWYIYNGDNDWTYVLNQELTSNISENAQIYLGYKLNITYSNGATETSWNIFVNEKGYYQVPSDTFVKEIILDPDAEDEVIIDYILHYTQSYNTNTLPSRKRTIGRIVGQWGGMYPVNTYAGPQIYEKYNIIQYKTDDTPGQGNIIDSSRFINFIQKLDYWQGVSVDVSPYSLIGVKYQGAAEYQKILVGRTGVFSMIDDVPTDDVAFLGRKMFLVDRSRQPYLDEWEYTLDETLDGIIDSSDAPINWQELQNTQIIETGSRVLYYFAQQVDDEEDADIEIPVGMENIPFQEWANIYTSNPFDISHPEINRVYPLTINGSLQCYIYYIDYKWYPITLTKDGTALAAVPVYGYINYIGNIVRSEYK